MIGQNGQCKRGNTGKKMGKKKKTSYLWGSPENSTEREAVSPAKGKWPLQLVQEKCLINSFFNYLFVLNLFKIMPPNIFCSVILNFQTIEINKI
jgi:hypothetical protein